MSVTTGRNGLNNMFWLVDFLIDIWFGGRFEIQILNSDHAIHFAISLSRRNHSMDLQATTENPLSQKMPLFAEIRRESYFCLARPSQKVQIGHHKSHHSGKPIHTLFSRPIHKKYRSANQTSKLCNVFFAYKNEQKV